MQLQSAGVDVSSWYQFHAEIPMYLSITIGKYKCIQLNISWDNQTQ